MARKLRLECAGACYHVINRGNYRRDLFASAGAAESFRACLFEASQRFGWRLHAFVIMRNHFHLAVETGEPNLSDGMKWLQRTWAVRFNRYRSEVGRPFQGRYKALHVEPGHALAQVAHYLHLNPVRARTVTAGRLLDYKWSSLPLFESKPRPECLVPDTVLRESGDLPDTPGGWRRYREYLAALVEEELKLRQARFGRLSRGWAIGSGEFKTKLKNDLELTEERFAVLGGDASAHRELRALIWEEKLQQAARALGSNLKKFPAPKSAPEKVAIAALMKAATSVSNGWLAERLDMGPAASVSQYVRRFRLAGHPNGKAFRQALSMVNT